MKSSLNIINTQFDQNKIGTYPVNFLMFLFGYLPDLFDLADICTFDAVTRWLVRHL